MCFPRSRGVDSAFGVPISVCVRWLMFFGLNFVRRIWRLLIDACLSRQVYASNVTGVWLNALCALPSSPGSRRGLSGVGIKTQLCDEHVFVGRGIIALPQGG